MNIGQAMANRARASATSGRSADGEFCDISGLDPERLYKLFYPSAVTVGHDSGIARMNALAGWYYNIHNTLFPRLQYLDGLAPLAIRLYLFFPLWMAGTQKISGDLRYGLSITDPCIDWATTEHMLNG